MNVFCKISVDLFFFTTHNYYSCAVPFVFHIFFIIQIQLNNVETMQGLYLSFICFFFAFTTYALVTKCAAVIARLAGFACARAIIYL